MRAQTGLVVFCGNRRGAPILDAYEQLLSPYRQRRDQQLGILHAFCPHCQRWRVHGHALGEGKTVRRASHCVECPTVETGYMLRIIGPWSHEVRRQCHGRYKPPAPRKPVLQH
jgi:hypothetical protein